MREKEIKGKREDETTQNCDGVCYVANNVTFTAGRTTLLLLRMLLGKQEVRNGMKTAAKACATDCYDAPGKQAHNGVELGDRKRTWERSWVSCR